MRVPGLIYVDEYMLGQAMDEQALEQVANVAFLPGIVGHSMAMPDIHWGYGFPIGGVAAMRLDDGVISPGGIGFDINCGVRLVRTALTEAEVRLKIEELATTLFHNIPSGVGSKGRLRLRGNEIDDVLREGPRWAVEMGYGIEEDLELTEKLPSTLQPDPEKVSKKAKERGSPQLGTLGSGNHFLEVQSVAEIYDPDAARVMGIESVGQVVVMIHTGSRGLGHQTCDDYLHVMGKAIQTYGIDLPDRQLACAPVGSPEGKEYLAAMAASANFAWTNRQLILHWTRESFAQVFGLSWQELGMHLIYDVCHNIGKIEEHVVDGVRMELCVHRKGATRAFPPGHPDIPQVYMQIGQPVLIPGDMGRYSFLLVGTETAMRETFGSTCHGAGRMQSRGAAKRSLKGVNIVQQLAAEGIVVRVQNPALLAEEASVAYKDVEAVVNVVHGAGLSRKVAKMRPLAVVKG
ncbi:MAG: RtcB family protein [Chloroflexi bacterium]|nr:RtcB family protein [Chloroflexota bacterium]